MTKLIASQERVYECAQELASRGLEPTVVTVQQALGGGSYSTVKRYLDQWMRSVRQPQRELPELAVEPLMGLGRQLWAILDQQAAQQVDSIRSATREQLAAMQGQLDQAEQVIAKLEADHERLSQSVEQSTQVLTAQQHQSRMQSERAAAAEARTGVLEARVADLKVELERAHGQLHTEQQAIAALRQQAEQAAVENAKLEGKLQALGYPDQPVSPSRPIAKDRSRPTTSL